MCAALETSNSLISAGMPYDRQLLQTLEDAYFKGYQDLGGYRPESETTIGRKACSTTPENLGKRSKPSYGSEFSSVRWGLCQDFISHHHRRQLEHGT